MAHEDPVEEVFEEAFSGFDEEGGEEFEDSNEEGFSEPLWGGPPSVASQSFPPLRKVASDSSLASPQPHTRVPKVLSYTEETKLRVQRVQQINQQGQRVKEEQKRRALLQKARLDEFRRVQRTKAGDTCAAKQEEEIKKKNVPVVRADPALVSALRTRHTVVATERSRVRSVREVIKAAVKIQRSWRRYCARRRAAAAAAAAAAGHAPRQPRVGRSNAAPAPAAAPSLASRSPVRSQRARPGPPAKAAATLTPSSSTTSAPVPAPAPAPTLTAATGAAPAAAASGAKATSPTKGLARSTSKISIASPPRPAPAARADSKLVLIDPAAPPPAASPTSSPPPPDHVHGTGCTHKGCVFVYPTYRPFKARPAPGAPPISPPPRPTEPARPVPALAEALGYKY